MEMTYDVIVVGAGTSGMMAAISAAEHGATVSYTHLTLPTKRIV